MASDFDVHVSLGGSAAGSWMYMRRIADEYFGCCDRGVFEFELRFLAATIAAVLFRGKRCLSR